MPKRQLEIEVHRIYEPDMSRMVKALRILLEYNPNRPPRPSGENGLALNEQQNGEKKEAV